VENTIFRLLFYYSIRNKNFGEQFWKKTETESEHFETKGGLADRDFKIIVNIKKKLLRMARKENESRMTTGAGNQRETNKKIGEKVEIRSLRPSSLFAAFTLFPTLSVLLRFTPSAVEERERHTVHNQLQLHTSTLEHEEERRVCVREREREREREGGRERGITSFCRLRALHKA
jgi:hypothetical protein